MMKKQLSPVVINALKEALSNVYWYKNDLRSFLTKSLPKNINLGYLDFENLTKREIANLIVDRLFDLNKNDELLKLAKDIGEFNSFEHLKHLDNAQIKITNTINAVNQLKKLIKPYQGNEQEKLIREQKKKENQDKIRDFKSYQDELHRIKLDFLNYRITCNNPQRYLHSEP